MFGQIKQYAVSETTEFLSAVSLGVAAPSIVVCGLIRGTIPTDLIIIAFLSISYFTARAISSRQLFDFWNICSGLTIGGVGGIAYGCWLHPVL